MYSSSKPSSRRHSASSQLTLTAVTDSEEAWKSFDIELARYLRERTEHRAKRIRTEASALDGMAMTIRRVRVTLEAMTDFGQNHDDSVGFLVSRAYRWTIRIARELEAIERLDLDPIREWARFEAFAPFARAFFESALAGPFDGATRSPDVLRLRSDIDGVMAPIRIALMSSAVAA